MRWNQLVIWVIQVTARTYVCRPSLQTGEQAQRAKDAEGCTEVKAVKTKADTADHMSGAQQLDIECSSKESWGSSR